jgi:hypothetical protein
MEVDSMASHFSTIGFHVSSDKDLWEIAQKTGPQSEALEAKNGAYFHWQDRSGAEVWLQVNQENEFIGINPHFAGKSRVNVGITNVVNRPGFTPLDGALHGWAEPSSADFESGYYPFVFDLPDLDRHRNLQYPCLVMAQIAAFAHELSLYDSVASYDSAPHEEPKFASQSFIPAGLFSPSEGSIAPPQSYAIFTGHIVESEERTNSLTGTSFFWCLVETLGAAYDVVIDPELVAEKPNAGGVLSGHFWLSGTILSVQ